MLSTLHRIAEECQPAKLRRGRPPYLGGGHFGSFFSYGAMATVFSLIFGFLDMLFSMPYMGVKRLWKPGTAARSRQFNPISMAHQRPDRGATETGLESVLAQTRQSYGATATNHWRDGDKDFGAKATDYWRNDDSMLARRRRVIESINLTVCSYCKDCLNRLLNLTIKWVGSGREPVPGRKFLSVLPASGYPKRTCPKLRHRQILYSSGGLAGGGLPKALRFEAT